MTAIERGAKSGRRSMVRLSATGCVSAMATAAATPGCESASEPPLHGPAAPRTDVDPLLDKPFVRQRFGLPPPTQDRASRHPDILEDELRVTIRERVGVVGVVGQPHAGPVVVDEEERRQACVA